MSNKVAHIEITTGTESTYMQSKTIDHAIDLATRKLIAAITEAKTPTLFTIRIEANEIK